MNEIWKSVVGYEGLYEVSDWGNVKSLNYRQTGREKVLNPSNNKGYLQVVLSKNKMTSPPLKVYRLAAMAFIPIPERLKDYNPEELDVHHVDFNPLNNRVENLEWLTKEEHRELHSERGRSEETKAKIAAANKGKKQSEETKTKIAAANKGKKRSEETKAKITSALSKAVEAYDKDGNVILRFSSTTEAERNGFNHGSISSCCQGRLKTHRGLHWRYIQ